MEQIFSFYHYECEKHFATLEKVSDDLQNLGKIENMDHPLVSFFKTYRNNSDKRKEILYGKDVKYAIELDEETHFNWEIFEYSVLFPLFRYRRVIPRFKEKTQEIVSIQITRKIPAQNYRTKLRKSLKIIVETILRHSPGVEDSIRSKIDSGHIVLTINRAVLLICGSNSFDEFQYPGYDAIIQRIKICLNNATENNDIDWKKWIQHDDLSNKLRICSVLDKSFIDTSLKNLLGEKEIKTEIFKDERGSGRILGGITIIKDVHDNNASDILKQVEELTFIKYPFPRNEKCNHIRVASVVNNQPLQYSKGSSIFFVLSVKMKPIEKELLQKANEIAFNLYTITKARLIQKYGPKVAHEVTGKFIPYSSCLWSCQRANDAGYGIHQDSTTLSSANGCHYQEIVVTMVFHIDCVSNDILGAELIVALDEKGRRKKRYKTFHNSIHVQNFGNQTNLWHQAGSIGTNEKGYRLVMTARRTGVDDPETVMDTMLERKCNTVEPLERKIIQTIYEPTLREIMDDEDGNLQFGTGSDFSKRPRKKQKKEKQKSVINLQGKKRANTDKNDATMNPPPPVLPVVDDNDSQMGSSADIYDTKHYYSFNESTVETTSNPSSYIEFGHGHDFLLHQSSVRILFGKKICIRTYDRSSKKYVRWAPMIRNCKFVEVGKELPMSWYKDYHNIKKSKIGGYIVSRDHETATGICLLHPERTDEYNDIITKVVENKSMISEIHFYGSGGAAKVMGSHPTLISTQLCGAGGVFASDQTILNQTNECLINLCTSERPLHIALKSKNCDDRGNEQVVYLGMFYIEGYDYGYHTPHEKFKLGINCDNLMGASFMDAKTFLFKAVAFEYDDGDDENKLQWREYTIEKDSPMSFGVVVPKKASDVLRADNDFKRKQVFVAMESVIDFEKILNPLVDLPLDQAESSEKEEQVVEEEEKEKGDEENLISLLDDLAVNDNDSDEDFMVTY